VNGHGLIDRDVKGEHRGQSNTTEFSEVPQTDSGGFLVKEVDAFPWSPAERTGVMHLDQLTR
jgi:hypothetical protein